MDKDKQMQFLFEEGGIADDGMNRDPISGNEIPPGSLAEEVRDDIPAQLSEGEYVVPADVLRYYGVKFFEDLRTQAKMGLGEMEEDGRIGGEPIPADPVIDSQLSPEEEAELQAMMGMAVGGFVTEQPTQATDPYMAQAQLYRAPAPVAVGNTMEQRGFNEGGLTEADTKVQFDPAQFPAGFSFARPAQRPQTMSVTLYGPNGEVRPVLFPSDEYDRLIAEGYSTQQAGGAEVTSEASPEVTGETGGGGGGGGGFTTFGGGVPRDLSELSVEELQANLDGLNTMGRIGGALAIAVNPMFGLAASAALNSNRVNLVRELESRGVDMSDYRDERGRNIFGGGISMYDGLQDQPGSRSGVDFGDTWLGDLLGFDGKAGVQGPGLKESREGARRSFDGGSTAPATIGSTNNRGGRDDSNQGGSGVSSRGDSAADVEADDRARGGGGGASSRGSTAGAPASSGDKGWYGASAGRSFDAKDSRGEAGSATGGKGDQGKGSGWGGMNQGGFVSRRNKKNKK